MMDRPNAEELHVQVEMLNRWLKKLVNLDDGADLDMSTFNDEAMIARIEETMRKDWAPGFKPVKKLGSRKSKLSIEGDAVTVTQNLQSAVQSMTVGGSVSAKPSRASVP